MLSELSIKVRIVLFSLVSFVALSLLGVYGVQALQQVAIKSENLGQIQLYFILSSSAVLLLLAAIGYLIGSSVLRDLAGIQHGLSAQLQQLRLSSDENSKSYQNLSANTETLAHKTKESNSSLEELKQMLHRTDEFADKSHQRANDSHAAAVEGKKSVAEMMQAMSDIENSNHEVMRAVTDSNESLSEVTQIISSIEAKTKIINDIVFQTKLLSFNASVEAARAGEHGKGFSVVAEEVGNLAQLSGVAAQEISKILEESVHAVQQLIQKTNERVQPLIKEGEKRVTKGKAVAALCEGSLDKIVSEVAQVNKIIDEISQSSKQQRQNLESIKQNMVEMEMLTQAQHPEKKTEKKPIPILTETSQKISRPPEKEKTVSLKREVLPSNKEPEEKKNVVVSFTTKLKKTAAIQSQSSEVKKKREVQVKSVANGADFPSGDDPRFEEF